MGLVVKVARVRRLTDATRNADFTIAICSEATNRPKHRETSAAGCDAGGRIHAKNVIPHGLLVAASAFGETGPLD